MSSSSSNSLTAHISVIIVTYNNGDDILPCLHSLMQNSKTCRLQIIIVDNNSNDSTQSKIRSFHEPIQPFSELQTVFNRTNEGFTTAVNQGLALATAPFILFLNPDTVLPPNTLVRLVGNFRDNEEIGIVAPQLQYEDGTVQPSCRRFPRHRDIVFVAFGLAFLFSKSRYFNGWKMGDFDHAQQCFVHQPQGACLLTKREIIEKVGVWDEGFPMFFSDVDWCHRAIRAGYKILFTPEVHVVHHKGKSVFPNRPQMMLSSHRSFVRYFWKYYRAWVWWVPNMLVSILLVFSGFLRYVYAKTKNSEFIKGYP